MFNVTIKLWTLTKQVVSHHTSYFFSLKRQIYEEDGEGDARGVFSFHSPEGGRRSAFCFHSPEGGS